MSEHVLPAGRGPDSATWDFEVFFDGDCPLCNREIRLLRCLDRRHRIRFTDIAAEDFDGSSLGIRYDELMEEIHGRLPDGEWVQGVEVFRRLYAAIGLGWVAAWSRWPGIAHVLDVGYRVFARNRLLWTGGCTSACEVRRLH